jgi:hypothetical protein
MATTLPIDIYDILEKKVGRGDAREIGKAIEFSLDAIEKKAEGVALQKKLELKDELTKELVTKAEFFGETKTLRGEMDKLRVELKLEMRIFFLILLFTIIILNPTSIELLSKLLRIAR